jgi:SAM-dependent methyltransferase
MEQRYYDLEQLVRDFCKLIRVRVITDSNLQRAVNRVRSGCLEILGQVLPVLGQPDINISERIVEIPLALYHVLAMSPGKVLDAGGYTSVIPLHLASLGYQVWVVDMREYPFEHPNLSFSRQDICNLKFPDEFFDIVISISVIEHIGLGKYSDPIYEDGDKRAMVELNRVLSKSGKMVISLPFGVREMGEGLRVYDRAAIDALFRDLEIQELLFFERHSGMVWLPSTEKHLANQRSAVRPVNGCIVAILRKP